jgi:hypothetical protein
MGCVLKQQSFHFACFTCRKNFKKHVQREMDFHTGNFVTYQLPPFNCPDCSRPLQLQGRDFAAPRKDRPHRWQQLRQQQGRTWQRFVSPSTDSYQASLERSNRRRRDERRRARMDARIDREKLQMLKAAAAKE